MFSLDFLSGNKTVFFSIFLFFVFSLTAQQNLVPNGSFETYSQCPDPATVDPMPANMIELATGWGNPTGYTPDYFATCVTSNYSIPANDYGSQNARTGNAYAGLITMYGGLDAREYIQTQLTTPLIAGKQYLVTFYVCLGKVCTYAANDIGAYFSNTPVSVSHSLVLLFSPQISNNPFTNPLTDTVGWTEVSGVFTAQGGEQYMTIGNFNNDATTDTTHKSVIPSPYWEASYHYIDDVSVVCLDCPVGIYETSIDSKISVFPNPATDYLNINFDDIYPERITLFNGMGQTLLVKNQLSENTQINVADYQAGIYFLKIETKENSITKRFLITK
ncbi:MAG: T9SS type A sorting domain-containing protein [Crocinitomicaceae bacterium]|nr:T9SS type A sorting domain-containing protein [Crocinitomicaceae bacterium]